MKPHPPPDRVSLLEPLGKRAGTRGMSERDDYTELGRRARPLYSPRALFAFAVAVVWGTLLAVWLLLAPW